MGLGPPVCTDCRVIGEIIGDTWTCPMCYSIRLGSHLWEYTKEYQQQFEANTRFARFMRGRDEGSKRDN